ncbi:MAG: LytTR family DNA-binding domain-containing protein [Flavobacteriales bacterium]|nr:LytTR family DNA-binding domain-containing protein [Flavobacteriales bacterium]MDG1765433.1 LytTR family DNA-binding domain-containing protein [Flavobacteriales bacterium]
MKALIVEDSRLARLELKELLSVHQEIEVVGEAENAEVAERLIEELDPDLLFLDINMPGKNGFELLESLDAAPQVIFTTAYDEFAIKSFEYNALDYLLKPIKEDRLAKALGKLDLRSQENKLPTGDYLGPEQQVFVKDGEKCWLVKIEDIRLFEVCGNYSRVYFDQHKPLILRSLNQLEERLDPEHFFRANRQEIINLKKISKIEPWFNGRLKVWMDDQQEVEVSRRQAVRFKELLSL